MRDLEALRLHISAMFLMDGQGTMTAVNEPWDPSGTPPLLYVGKTLSGEQEIRFGAGLPHGLRQEVLALARSGPLSPQRCCELLGGRSWEEEVCFCLHGPCPGPPPGCVEVTGENISRLNLGEFRWLEEELPAAGPCFVYLEGGEAVSACRSVRAAAGHEAGIETLPASRRRGRGLAVLSAWTIAVLRRGRVPLYSALTTNAASQALAAKAGYRRYASGFSVMR
ncbi:MAG TPA: GNAT family N-acetyltransferase [Candidatus Caccousia avistercoris]|nr:GNAT family N-acetyltransferase [Candidatus Caccousia avistercoris]